MYMYICICTCMCVCVCICIHVCMYVYVYVYVYIYMCMHVSCVCVHAYVLHVVLLALGQPSAMMSSSLHHLQKVLLLLLSSNRYSSRILTSIFVYQAWMQASPRRGCVSQGYPLAMMNGCSSLFRRRQLQSRSTLVSLTLYLMFSFTTRCCASARTLVLLVLGRNTPTPLISDILVQVDATILQVIYPRGTTNAHGGWTPVFRCFLDIKLQLPHFRRGFGVTPNADSAISVLYAACCVSHAMARFLLSFRVESH